MSNASRLGSLFKSGSLSQLGSFLGSIGITGSLLLVAYELKPSREIAELQFAYAEDDLVELKNFKSRTTLIRRDFGDSKSMFPH